MGVELDVNGKIVYVFTTHLQGGDGGPFFQLIDRGKPSPFEISAIQLREARRVIEDFAVKKTAPIFLVGDFNITADEKNEEYRNGMMALVDAKDTFNPNKSRRLGSVWDAPDTNRVDYMMSFWDRKCREILLLMTILKKTSRIIWERSELLNCNRSVTYVSELDRFDPGV